MSPRALLTSAVAALTLSLATPAFADVVLPENEACEQAQAGDACTAEGVSGTCQDSMCCRATPEGSDCSACLKCEASPDEESTEGCAAAPASPAPESLVWLALLGAGVLIGARRTRR